MRRVTSMGPTARWFGLASICSALALGAAALVSTPTIAEEPSPPSTQSPATAGTTATTGTTQPDALSAQSVAASLGKRVLDQAASTQFTNLYANPDGTWTEQTSPVPFQTKASDGTWVPINNDLESGWGGRLVPQAGDEKVSFSDGGDTAVASMTVDGQSVGWTWPTVLPTPTVSGATATYQLSSTEQLVLTASAAGFTDDIVLTAPPTTQANADFTLPMEVAGSTLATTEGTSPDGAVLTDSAGKGVLWASSPIAYDSSRGAGGPSYSPVQVGVGTYQAGGVRALNGGGTAGTPGQTGHASGGVGISLAPAWSWLTSPSTVYPVTIDPSFSSLTTGDAWVNSSFPSGNNNGGTTLQVGDNSASGWVARTFLHFNAAAMGNLSGATIQSAALQLYNINANSCTLAPIDVQRVSSADWNANTLDWSNQPSTAGDIASFSPAYGYSSSCSANNASWDVTSDVRQWASGASPNYGLRVRAENEGNANSWRVYRSQEWGSNEPQLSVTYTNPNPVVPGSLSMSPCADDCDPAWETTTTLTPTFDATSTADGTSSLTYNWQIEDQDSQTVLDSGTSSASPGSAATWTVPAGDLADNTGYSWRVEAVNGSLVSGWTDWQDFGTAVAQSSDAPTDLSLTPCVGDDCSSLSTTSLTPILTADAGDGDTDGDDTVAEEVTFEVRAAGTTTVLATTTIETASGQSTSFRVPSGSLTSTGNYEFRASGINDDGITTWSDWTPFTVVAPSGPTEPQLSMTGCEEFCDQAPWVAPTSTPTLTVVNEDSQQATIDIEFMTDGGPTLSTTIPSVGAGQSTSWVVPSGSLGHGRYLVRAGANNSTATTWTGWQEITVDQGASVAADPTLDQDTSTLPPTPDASNDNEDVDEPSTSSSQEASADASLAAEAAADPSDDAVTDGYGARISDADDNATQSFNYMAQRFAPDVFLDKGEPYYPESTKSFINHAELEFYHSPQCPPGDQVYGPSQRSLSDTTHVGHPWALEEDPDYPPVLICAQADSTNYYPYQDIRPWDKNNVMGSYFYNQGFTLRVYDSNVLDGFKSEKTGPTISSPVYVRYQAGNYLTYWFFYGDNAPYHRKLGIGYSVPIIDHHQGDWERITVKLSPNNTAEWVEYHQHYTSCDLPWSEVTRDDGTHPVVWSAGGTHASYPPNIASTWSKLGWHDEISGDGTEWLTYPSTRALSKQDWYGYGGAWGAASQFGTNLTGPMGPGPYKSSAPKWNEKCQLN